jgi:predicted enzyme related to lactoylglutathione lyase
MNRPFRAGEAVWVELCTTDPAASETFYSALLGWSVRHERLGSTVYRMCSLDGRDVAGISDAAALHGGRRRGWITYFAVDDIDAAAQQAVAGGGELVTEPRHLPAAGSGATVVDPFGAVFGLYEGRSRAGVEALNSPGALCWNELDTGEPEKSIDYYCSLFGFGTEVQHSPTAQPYTVLKLDDVAVAGVLRMDNDWPNLVPSTWVTYFSVTSLDDAVDRVVELGGTPSVGPFDSPHGRLQMVRDPGGHTLCLVELRDRLRPDHLSTSPAVIA